LEKAKSLADARYTPELNIELPIAQVFDGLGRTRPFFDRMKSLQGRIRRGYSHCRSEKAVTTAQEAYSRIEETLNKLLPTLGALDSTKMAPIDFDEIARLSKTAEGNSLECMGVLSKAKLKSGEQSARESFGFETHYLYELAENLRTLVEQAGNTESQLANNPFLLLSGVAGTGKTHLFCDLAHHRIKQGLPTFLFLGEQFRNSSPWSQIAHMISCPTQSKAQLLSALNDAGRLSNSRFLILIDALNEGQGTTVWKKHMTRMIKDIKEHPYIGLAISIRTGHEKSVLTPAQIEFFIATVHRGFEFKEWEAITKFFKEFKISLPEIPLLMPEFQNPLFLKIFCQTYEGEESLPRGALWGTKLFERYVKKMGGQIYREIGLPRSRRGEAGHLFWDLIVKRIAESMGEKSVDRLAQRRLLEIVENVVPGHSRPILEGMKHHWLVTKVPRYNRKGIVHSYAYRFPYNRFSDHLIVRYLLNNHLDKRNPDRCFSKSSKLGKMIRKPENRGLVEALSIQIPQRLRGVELLQITPVEFTRSYQALEAFLQSLLWRDLSIDGTGNCKFIKEKTVIGLINKYIIRHDHLHDRLLDIFLTVACVPEHPLNADFLHAHLMKFSPPERDRWWSTFLHYQYGERKGVDRLLEWAGYDVERAHISDEPMELCGLTVAWFLASSNRRLRDTTTKALVRLYTGRLHLMRHLLHQLKDVNDPYVLERLYATAYGVSLRNRDGKGLKELTQYIYDNIFVGEVQPTHILLRDYARGVIEVAIHRGVDMKIDRSKIKPPYMSDWVKEVPTQEELEEKYSDDGYGYLKYSIMSDGDFNRYIIAPHLEYFSSRKLGEPRKPSMKEQYEAFLQDLTEQQKRPWESFHKLSSLAQILARIEDAPIESMPGDIAKEGIEEPLEEARSAFEKTLTKDQLVVYTQIVAPFEKKPIYDEYRFDFSLAKRWIFQRVTELGWTPDLFANFDRSISHDRTFGKAYGLGPMSEKYQWIAYHEFMARVSDHFEFREDKFKDKASIFEGPWQLGIRNIDPSYLPSTQPVSEDNETHHWWNPVVYDAWESRTEDAEWIKATADLPDPKQLIQVTDEEGREWLVLKTAVKWQEDMPPEYDLYEIPRRDLWYTLNSYVIKKAHLKNVFDWAKTQDFWETRMPESQQFSASVVFLREYPWARPFLYRNTPHYGHEGWTKGDYDRIPKPILATDEEYLERNDSVQLLLPSKSLIDSMKLRATENDGEYSNPRGEIVVIDPTGRASDVNTLLVRRGDFTSFLNANGYGVLWILQGAKGVIGGDVSAQDFKGRLRLNGAYRSFRKTVIGDITCKFDAPRRSETG